MDVLDAIKARRAVKRFKVDHKITDEEIEKLISLAMLSPTAYNLQHWRFVVVKDPELRKEIRKYAWDQIQVTEAPLLIILCADTMAWMKNPERYWVHAPDYPKEEVIKDLDDYYKGKPQTQRDEAMRSCGIAAQTIMLAAQGMGYDSCPMDLFDFAKIAELIRLPSDHLVSMMIAVGKIAKPPRVRGGKIALSEAMIVDRFR